MKHLIAFLSLIFVSFYFIKQTLWKSTLAKYLDWDQRWNAKCFNIEFNCIIFLQKNCLRNKLIIINQQVIYIFLFLACLEKSRIVAII